MQNMTAAPDMTEVATAAYRLTTDGLILQATDWQSALYDQLSTRQSDIGFLLATPTGVGKTEAVVVPALGLQRGGAPRRVFLIGPDGSCLDDYLYRLVPYLRAMVGGDETPRTLCVDITDDPGSGNQCRRFFPDGSEDPSIEVNPLEADVDLVLTTFSRFRDLFFGGGGIHALSSTLGLSGGIPLRRDLFFFDEAHTYDPEGFSRFHRLAEFLFAEDTDVVIGTTTMPSAYAEEFNFLETIAATPQSRQAVKTLQYHSAVDPLAAMEQEIRRAYYQNSRVFGVAETPGDAESLYQRLLPSYPHSVYLYHPGQEADARRLTYAQLRELEKEGEGYLLLTTGSAVETSDLDATILLSTLCPPENLIRRAGRCNRRGDLPDAEIILVGDTFARAARALPTADDYLAALQEQCGAPFDADFWKVFI